MSTVWSLDNEKGYAFALTEYKALKDSENKNEAEVSMKDLLFILDQPDKVKTFGVVIPMRHMDSWAKASTILKPS